MMNIEKWTVLLLLIVVQSSCAITKSLERRHPSLSFNRKLLSFRGGSDENEVSDDLTISEEGSASDDEVEETLINDDEEISPDVEEPPEATPEAPPEAPPAPVESPTVEITTPKKSLLSQSAIERIGGAVILLISLSTILSIFGSNGMIFLCLASQLAMFQEVYSVTNTTPSPKYQKWLSFATVLCFTSLRALSDTSFLKCILPSEGVLTWIGYGFGVATLLSSVVSMEYNAQKIEVNPTEIFKSILGSQVTTLFSLLFLLGQSTYWIYTLQLPSTNPNYGLQCILYSLLLVIINDTMAYVCGKAVGKTPLLPNLSPNKTLEGFIGAAFFTIVSSPFLWNAIVSNSGEPKPMVLALFASFVAPFGGFLASAVKRSFGKKDYGSLIPGHGGVMDRLDCHLIMAPFTYLYLSKLQP